MHLEVTKEECGIDKREQLTIVNTTSRNFDDLNRRSIRSHAAAFGRRRQKEAKAKKVVPNNAVRVRKASPIMRNIC